MNSSPERREIITSKISSFLIEIHERSNSTLSVWVKTRTWVAKAMKAYRAIGTFRNGRTEQNYSLDVVATDEDEARHLVYSNFGSRHGTPRRFINIDSMSEIEPTNSTEPRVIAHFRDTHDFSAPPAQNEEE